MEQKNGPAAFCGSLCFLGPFVSSQVCNSSEKPLSDPKRKSHAGSDVVHGAFFRNCAVPLRYVVPEWGRGFRFGAYIWRRGGESMGHSAAGVRGGFCRFSVVACFQFGRCGDRRGFGAGVLAADLIAPCDLSSLSGEA